MTEILNMSRRGFIQSSLLTASGLLLGCTPSPTALSYRTENTLPKTDAVATWLHIDPEGVVTVLVPSSEMGQGVASSLPMLVAEELEVDWQKVQIEFAPLNAAYNNPEFFMQGTGGSNSIKVWSEPLRKTGATAREMLKMAAAQQWGIPVTQCTTANGAVRNAQGQSLPYGQLAEAAATLEPPKEVPLKSPDQFRFLGQPLKRLDTPCKVDGTCEFGIDVTVPGMVYATVAQSPVFGGTVKQMDKAAAMASAGVEAIVEVPNGVAVVADSYWHAKKGLSALQVQFDAGRNAQLNDATISQKFREILDAEGKRAFPTAHQTLDLEYQVPYLAHATMEPMNFTAHVQKDHCDLWGPTQVQTLSAKTVEAITGLSEDQITLHTTYLGGGFGRRAELDFVEQAVTISQAVQKPVKLIWSREEDTQHDFYRQAAMMRLQLGLDAQGNLQNWAHQFVSPSLLERYFEVWAPAAINWLPITGLTGDAMVQEGATENSLPYAIPEVDLQFDLAVIPVPVGVWRSVAHSYNGFFIESAVDEAAHAAGEDPYQYRRRMLKDDPRHRLVLDLAAEKAGWGKASEGRFQGIALHKSFDTYVCEVAEVSLEPELKVHRVVAAVDCGVVVNPNTVIAQIESGIVYGLVAALQGEINIEKGRVVQSNFHDYPMLTLANTPEIEVHIVSSQEPSTGVGEPGTPPIAPAVTNAIFAASGQRIRTLPILKNLQV